MRCDDFRAGLHDYLEGHLGEGQFAEMVEHEAECSACHGLACARQSEAAGPAGETPPEARPRELIDSILARTTGDDCLYMEQRLADRTTSPLPNEQEARLARHLQNCASCRRLRDVLDELPEWYGAMSRVKADRSFTLDVMEQTIGRPAGF